MARLRRPTPRAKRPVKRGRRHGRSGPRKRVTVFLNAPLLKKVSRMLEAEGRTLEAVLEEVLAEWWLKHRQIPDDAEGPES